MHVGDFAGCFTFLLCGYLLQDKEELRAQLETDANEVQRLRTQLLEPEEVQYGVSDVHREPPMHSKWKTK